MTTTVTDTTKSTEQNRSMFDSGFSSTSLRLTLHDDDVTQSQASSMMFSSNSSESQQPVVLMPGGTSSILSYQRQDSGIAAELNQLSLSADSRVQANPDSWKEYYEPDDDGDVQLHLAIASGYIEVVDSLIRLAPSTEYLSIQNNQMYGPLHIAVLRNHPVIVRHLVIAGARLDIQDHEGNTPLHLAARRGHVECGEALLRPVSIQEMSALNSSASTSPQVSQLSADIVDMPNHQGENPVHLATMGGHVGFLQFLSWNNADMNAQEGRAGRTSLHFAVGARNLTTIQCLLEPKPHGCGANPNLLDWYGRTPYQLSIINSLNDITQYLANRSGIDLSGIDSDESIDEQEYGNAELMSSVLLDSNA